MADSLHHRSGVSSSLSITYVGHATCLVEMQGVRVLTDPILRNRIGHIRRHSRPVHADGHEQIDAVTISHLHHDHLDVPSLRRIGRSTRMIVPAGSADILAREGFTHIEEVRAGDSTKRTCPRRAGRCSPKRCCPCVICVHCEAPAGLFTSSHS